MDQINAQGQRTTTIHFVSDVNGEWRVACMPNMTEFHETAYHPCCHRANDVRAVTCPTCKKMDVFKASQDALSAALRGTNRARP